MIIRYDKSNVLRKELLQLSDCYPIDMQTLDDDAYRNDGCWKNVTIPGPVFIRRFLMHVPPKRFVRIRHYGLLSSRNKARKIALCRNLLGCQKYISRLKGLDAPAMIRLLYNKDVFKCTFCGGRIKPVNSIRYITEPAFHLRC